MSNDDTAARKMLLLEDVLNIVPMSEATLYRMQQLGRFPRSHPLTPGKGQRRFWFEDEIRAWQNTLEEQF